MSVAIKQNNDNNTIHLDCEECCEVEEHPQYVKLCKYKLFVYDPDEGSMTCKRCGEVGYVDDVDDDLVEYLEN